MMMDNWIRGPAAVLGLAAFLAMSPGEADAGLISCDSTGGTDLTGKVHNGSGTSAVSHCQYIDPPDQSNTAKLSNINEAGFFGTTNWAALQMQVEDGGQSGTWSIIDPNWATFDYMIVFKDGQGTNLIGFLFNELYASGGWDTPFVNPPFTEINGGPKDVSHYSIVVRDSSGKDVPEPGVLGLMGLGLLGLGLAAYTRRRRGA